MTNTAGRSDAPATVAVVGGGVAGAGAAASLGDHGCEVTVFERAPTVGGRAATRRRDGCVYDYGANYVKGHDDRVAALVRGLDEGDLVDVEAPVWTFDAAGTVEPGDPDRADDHKWTFEDGLETLSRRLLERSGATVATGTAVDRLERADDVREWTVRTDADASGPFDAVVLTPPGPRTAALLERSAVGDLETATAAVVESARAVPYRRVHSFALHYPVEFERPYYALVDTDREHAISWLAREGEKRGHVPAGETLLVVQMASDWSVANREAPAAEAADDVASRVAALVDDERLASPDWIDRRRWRYALPEDGADEGARALESAGVFVAGDWLVGKGRISGALSSGLSAGDDVAEWL